MFCISEKSINLQELKERIVSFDNVLIICHTDPDPDTLGSALGLKQIFEKLNKTAYVVCDSKVNDRICGFFEITPELDLCLCENSGFKHDYIICVDAASVNLIGKYNKYYSENTETNEIDLVIDHHYTNSFYGKETYLDDKTSAAGEIIFNLARVLNIEIDQIMAKNLYCAITCDSGSFRYSSTTPKTMQIASDLIATGFDFAKLNRLIYQNKTMTQVAIERLAYNSLKFCLNGKIAFVIITAEMKKNAGLEGVKIDGINEIPRNIEGVEVGAVIKESELGDSERERDLTSGKKIYKISLRSNEYVNVAEVAARFGGGGHMRAAGCLYEGNIDELEFELEKILTEKIEAVL